ncbi:MAG TPA: alpha/beta fold hydrolase [Gemmatimonadaceae bacterium]
MDTGATAPRTDTLMVDVGGHRLRMVVAGRGTPTVVLEAGLGGGIGDWDEVLPGVARFTRVVAYDRAGYGGSDSVTGPRTARRVAAELHEALARADIRPPYVLVGHSLGGAFVRVYAAAYPGEVAGLVLVDPAMEEFYRRAAELPEWKAVQAEHERRVAHASAAERGEWLAWDSTMAQLRAAHPLPAVPIIMLTAAGSRDGRGGELLRMWDEVQAKWVGRTPGARQIVATKSGHCIQCDEPELVIDAIRTVTGRGARAAARASSTSTAFTHVAVVDVEHGRVLRDRTVLIGGNRIREVGPSTRVRVPPGGVPVLTLPVASPAAGRHAVDSFADAGVDFIKVYNGLSRASFLAIRDEAKQRGVPVIGHVPRSVGALEASAAGLASIEHLTRVPQVCVPDSVNRAVAREWEERSKRPGHPAEIRATSAGAPTATSMSSCASSTTAR